MNPQREVTEEQTSRSLVEDARVQSGTNDVGPSTGREEQRNGAASSGASGSSGAELQRRLKVVRLSGNEHFSLVEVEDERKVICLVFPFSGEPECPGPGRKGCDCDLPTDGRREMPDSSHSGRISFLACEGGNAVSCCPTKYESR